MITGKLWSKRLKNVIAMILMVSIVLSATVSSNVYADVENEELIVKVESVEGNPGKNVEVVVSIENNPGIAGLQFEIKYDTEILQYVSATGITDTLESAPTINDESEGYIGYVMADAENYQEDGEILKLEFAVLDEVALKTETSVIIDNVLACDFDEVVVVSKSVDGVVKVVCAHDSMTRKVLEEATCTKEGKVKYECDDCEYSYEESILMLDHSWEDEYTVDKDPTCEEAGSKSIHCSECDAIKEGSSVDIAKEAHTYESEVVKAASCTEEGTVEYVCSECGDTYTESIEKIAHSWEDEYTVDKEPTYVETGVKSIHCSECDAIKEGSEEEIPVLEKQFLYGDATDDGKINVMDAVLMKKQIAGFEGLKINLDASDVNVDGRLNVMDAVMVLKYIAGFDVTLGQ